MRIWFSIQAGLVLLICIACFGIRYANIFPYFRPTPINFERSYFAPAPVEILLDPDRPLDETFKQGRRLYYLNASFEFCYGNEGNVVSIPEGFVTDYASIPLAGTAIFPSDGSYAAPAIIHDYLYATGTAGDERGRKFADDMFYSAMQRYGVNPLDAKFMYFFVRKLGAGGYGLKSDWKFYDVQMSQPDMPVLTRAKPKTFVSYRIGRDGCSKFFNVVTAEHGLNPDKFRAVAVWGAIFGIHLWNDGSRLIALLIGLGFLLMGVNLIYLAGWMSCRKNSRSSLTVKTAPPQ